MWAHTRTEIRSSRYLPSILDVYNKVDSISLEQVDKLARTPNTVVISCEMDLKWASYNVNHPVPPFSQFDSTDYLVDRVWEALDIVKIYTKKRGDHPDLAGECFFGQLEFLCHV